MLEVLELIEDKMQEALEVSGVQGEGH